MTQLTPPPVVLESADAKQVIHFFWEGDRYAHRIELGDGRTLHSVEGDSDTIPGSAKAWPCSPPIQQISLEEINGSPTVLGVGSAGSGHWSFSVEPTPTGFRYDVACRAKDDAAWLGSSYRTNDKTSVVAGEDSVLSQHPADMNPKENGQPKNNQLGEASSDSASVSSSEASSDSGQARFCASVSPVSTAASQTSRWRYEVS